MPLHFFDQWGGGIVLRNLLLLLLLSTLVVLLVVLVSDYIKVKRNAITKIDRNNFFVDCLYMSDKDKEILFNVFNNKFPDYCYKPHKLEILAIDNRGLFYVDLKHKDKSLIHKGKIKKWDIISDGEVDRILIFWEKSIVKPFKGENLNTILKGLSSIDLSGKYIRTNILVSSAMADKCVKTSKGYIMSEIKEYKILNNYTKNVVLKVIANSKLCNDITQQNVYQNIPDSVLIFERSLDNKKIILKMISLVKLIEVNIRRLREGLYKVKIKEGREGREIKNIIVDNIYPYVSYFGLFTDFNSSKF